MEENRYANNLPAEGKEDNANFSIYDLIQMVIGNWFWFLLSTVICISCALFYIYTTPKIYNRTATILIKDGKKGSETDLAAFGDLLGATARRNVDNEIIVLKSHHLMSDVVRRLNLHINYVIKHGLRTENLYRRSPIDVTFIDDNERQALAFELTPLSDTEFSLTKFVNRTSADSDREGFGHLRNRDAGSVQRHDHHAVRTAGRLSDALHVGRVLRRSHRREQTDRQQNGGSL